MMKVRKVKIGIKDVETLLNEFADAAGAIEADKKVKHERGVYFTNIQAFRKALTQKLTIDKNPLFYYFLRNFSYKEGTNNIVKREKTKLGKMEMQLLAYAQLRKKETIFSGEIAVALDISAEQEWK